jgi:Tol biopolymer transport system component
LFIAAAAGEDQRAYLQDIDGGQRTAIGPVGISSPTVSPDGQTIAAASPNGPVLFSANGSGVRSFRGAEADDMPVGWTANGGSLFVRRPKRLVSQIFRVEVATGRRTLVDEVSARDWAGVNGPPSVRITPDGKSYAYSFFRAQDDLFLVEGLK